MKTSIAWYATAAALLLCGLAPRALATTIQMATFQPPIGLSSSLEAWRIAVWNLAPHDTSAGGPLTSAAIDVVIDANVSGYETNIFPYPVTTGVSLYFNSHVYLVNGLGGLVLDLFPQSSGSSVSGSLGAFPGDGRISDAQTFTHTYHYYTTNPTILTAFSSPNTTLHLDTRGGASQLWGGYTFNSTIAATVTYNVPDSSSTAILLALGAGMLGVLAYRHRPQTPFRGREAAVAASRSKGV